MGNKRNYEGETVDLYSFSDPKKESGKTLKQKIRISVNVIASIFLTISIIGCIFSSVVLAYWDENPHEIPILNWFFKPSAFAEEETMEEEGEFEDLVYSADANVSYILVVGVDPQETLTDIIIVACIDHKRKTLNFLQIPRDTYIGDDIPTSKINAVHGNPRQGEKQINALRRKITNYFGIPLDHYVKFTVRGFANVIDALGGITVNIETPNSAGIDIMNPFTKKHERIGPGVTKLNGYQAVGFVRKRTGVKDGYVKGDIDRIEAQREVYVSLAKKLKSMSSGQMASIAKNCYSEVATDMTVGEIMGYAEEVQKVDMDKMGIYAVPGQFATYKRLSMWSPHKDEYIEIFNEHFNPYGLPITADDINMIELHKKIGNATRPSEVEQGGSLTDVKK